MAQQRRLRAFTLIELLVGIVIVGVIAAIAFVAYNAFISRARESNAQNEMSQVARLLQAKSAEQGLGLGEVALTRRTFGQYGISSALPPDVLTIGIGPARELIVGYDSGYVCTGLVFAAGRGGAAEGTPVCKKAEEPVKPTGLTLVSGDRQISALWNEANNSNPAEAVAVYRVYVTATGSSVGEPYAELPGSASLLAISNLINGTDYTVRVEAVNYIEQGAWVEAQQTPAATPAAPEGLSVSMGKEQAQISFTAGDDNGAAITQYRVQQQERGESTWTDPVDAGATSPVTAGALTAGTEYRFRLQAVNRIGDSPWSQPSEWTQAITTPSKVVGEAVTVSANKELTASWNEPNSLGYGTISEYRVETSADNGDTWTSVQRASKTATSQVITGLDQYTSYLVRITAINAAGDGPSVTTNAVMPNTGPSAVLGAKVASYPAALKQVTLSWTAPASTGIPATRTLSGYVISYRAPDGTLTPLYTSTSWPTTVPYTRTVTLPANSTEYELVIQAKSKNSGANEVTGPPSASFTASSTTWPEQIAPPSVAATANTRQSLSLSWSAPAAWTSSRPAIWNGGMNITGYDVQWREQGTQTWYSTTRTATSTTTSQVISNATKASGAPAIQDGVNYEVRVRALNAINSTNSDGTWAQVTKATNSTPTAAPSIYLNSSSSIVPDVAVLGKASIRVTGIATASNGGMTVTKYEVQYRPAGSSDWLPGGQYPAGTYIYPTGLPTDRSTLEFQIAAVNPAGVGPWSTTVTQTVQGAPNAPAGLNMVNYTTANASMRLNFTTYTTTPTATNFNGWMTPTSYEAQVSPAGQGAWRDADVNTVGANTATLVFSGLNPNTLYDYRVRATNPAGTSAWASVNSNRTPAVPTDPAFTVATGTNSGEINVNITPSSAFRNGSFTVQYRKPGDANWSTKTAVYSATTTPVVLTGLTGAAAYEVKVSQTTTWGTSPNTAAAKSVTSK